MGTDLASSETDRRVAEYVALSMGSGKWSEEAVAGSNLQ